MLDGVVLLLGLYLAVSPWVLNIHATNPNVATNNLVIGLSLAAFGLALALLPTRMYRLGWTAIPIGVWMIISPWVVTAGHNPTSNVIWNNAWTGGIAVVLGLAMATITFRAWPRRPGTRGA
ncbi:SPW repeat protein [Catenulispora subtropica]